MQLLLILLNDDDSLILLPIVGAILIIFLLAHSWKKSSEKKIIDERNKLDLKVRYQSFILSVKSVFPNSKIVSLDDVCARMEEQLYNPQNKIVGKIKVQYLRNGVGTVNGKVSSLYFVDLDIDFSFGGTTRSYKASKQMTNENYVGVINELYNQVIGNQDLHKRILATTY